MTTEFKHEYHEHKRHSAIAHLSESHEPGAIRLVIADMHSKTVILRQMTSKNKPREFAMTADEMEALIRAWTDFQSSNTVWETALQYQKEQEAQAEAERAAKVWLEIKALAESIPGLVIIAILETAYDYESEDDDNHLKDVTRYDVKLPALGSVRNLNYGVDNVLEAVKECVEVYNKHLQVCEESEKKNWYGEREAAIRNAINFLAEHRAFIAEKQKQEKEVVSAQ